MQAKTISFIILFLAVLLADAFPVLAQERSNPFDIVPRLQSTADTTPAGKEQPTTGETTIGTTTSTDNPFDIIRFSHSIDNGSKISPRSARKARRAAARTPELIYRRIKIGIVLGILILMAFLATVLRSFVNNSIMAFFNDNMMNQLYREQEGRGMLPFLLLYGFFLVNAGAFIFLLLKFYGEQIHLPVPDGKLLLFCLLGVTGLFLLKHLVLSIIGYVFPVREAVSRYNFNIIIFSIVIGIVLVPANILLAYGPENSRQALIYIVAGIIAAVYLFRSLRSLLITNNFTQFHLFHFLLYICTVEIAPALFLLKLIFNQLEG